MMEQTRLLTKMVGVGLKATRMLMISPFDIPPCTKMDTHITSLYMYI